MSSDKQFLHSLHSSSNKFLNENKFEELKKVFRNQSQKIPMIGLKETIDNDRIQAEIELSYIRSAITLCECGSNDIGAELHIGKFPVIGISLNNRLIPLLLAEAEEIEKFLRGEENNWE